MREPSSPILDAQLDLARASLSVLARAQMALEFMLQLYAGCLLSSSPRVGALLLAATLLAPFSALLSLLAVGTAVWTARKLSLLSDKSPPAVFTYSALFIGLIAARTFADPVAACLFALLGAMSSVLITASMREVGQRFGLPALSLPFVAVYLCALGVGRSLGLEGAASPLASHAYAALLPALPREYLEALGAIVCDGRAEVGLLIFCALVAAGRQTVLLTTLGFAVGLAASQAFALAPMLRVLLLLNSMFTALALGLTQPRGVRAYVVAALGALFCALCTPSLSAPLGKLALSPLSLPFNFSFYAVLLVAQKRDQQHTTTPAATQTHSVIA